MQKVLIISDTHGNQDNLRTVIENAGEFDLLIHCGDVEGAEEEIMQMAGCPCRMVSGNCDFFSRLPKELEFEIEEYRIFLCHGHNYGTSMGYENLIEEASSRGAGIVFCGHTHKPCIIRRNGVILVNPGSLSYPRQDGRLPSYCIMDTDRQGEAHFTINYLG